MQKAGRKSAASLTVVAARAIDGRPKAPGELTKSQAAIWERTVAAEPADFFKTAATQQLLGAYCRHVDAAEQLGQLLNDAMAPASECSLADLDKMLKMRDREQRGAVTMATKLRITNQSRYDEKTASTASKRASTIEKPWRVAG